MIPKFTEKLNQLSSIYGVDQVEVQRNKSNLIYRLRELITDSLVFFIALTLLKKQPTILKDAWGLLIMLKGRVRG